ncbi:MAG TPA: MBL fold metallo-hydrolase [Candidatus Binatia bacterium]|nr:MBL fold metallo-hydrolase [Candidatus Binatia bacterium]
MKLHILGCGDAFGSGGRNQSGYLVEAADRHFLMDCGPTTLLAMKRAGLDPRRLDVVFLSHLHGDHFGGLPFFFISYLYEYPRNKPLDIAGPAGSKERVSEVYRLLYGGDLPPVRFHILEPDRAAVIEGIHVFPFRVPHQLNAVSLGLKISYAGKQILFSGDSAWTDLFLSHARGVDLFLCECSFYEQESVNHLNYKILREKLAALACKKLVLTHLGEEMLQRRHELQVTCAEDGMLIEL